MVIGHWSLDIGQAERSPSHQELRLLQQRKIPRGGLINLNRVEVDGRKIFEFGV
jgi:hypothetical protein